MKFLRQLEILNAIYSRDISRIQALVKKRKDTEVTTKNGLSLLMLSAAQGNSNLVRYLIWCGANVNAKNEVSKNTALELATINGHTDVVRILLSNHAQINLADDSLLVQAAQDGYVGIVNLLLKEGCDVNSRDGDGCTALIRSVETTKNLGVIELLINNGADMNIAAPSIGTAFNVALTKLQNDPFNERLRIVIKMLKNKLCGTTILSTDYSLRTVENC